MENYLYRISDQTTTTLDIIHHLNIRKRKPYKTFNILNMES